MKTPQNVFHLVAVVHLIIRKVLFLSITRYVSIYVKAVAVECKDTVRHFPKGKLCSLGLHRVPEIKLGPNGDWPLPFETSLTWTEHPKKMYCYSH